MANKKNIGKLILAGAGPGDPELVTLKTVKWLQQADVVLVDRLVSEEILTNHVSNHAQIIYVGKQCRRGISTPQQQINKFIVEFAMLGKLIVRLKGGDVSIFSNVLDELQTANEHNIPFEIVPGITAALGAAAYAGIPLTARGHATAVRFLTCYKKDVVSEAYWRELAQTDDTLVFYMSSETLPMLVEKLTHFKIDEKKLLAIAEQATTPMQNVVTCSLYDYEEMLGEKVFLSPSLVIIGKVVALHEQYKWQQNNGNGIHYFEPLTATVASIQENSKERKHVSRA
jgi:uroporphyrin-III C-methyltransferase